MDKWIKEWIEERMDGWMDGWTENGWIHTCDRHCGCPVCILFVPTSSLQRLLIHRVLLLPL
jgi:hypothetical protein